MKKRILAISNHSLMLGGGEYSFLDLLSHLPAPWSSLAVVPGEEELAARLKKRGIKTQVIPLPSIRPWNLLNMLSSLGACFILCRRYRPALIYANGSRAALYGGIMGRMLRIPLIWHCRIADTDIYLDFLLCRLSHRIIANSRATAKRFKTDIQPNIAVVYNGIDLPWFKDSTIEKPADMGERWKIILSVARISREKRHDLILSAFEQVAPSDSAAHLVFLGSVDKMDPEWWEYVQRKSSRSIFANRIHWVDQVEDVRPWYRGAHMMVLASESEGFGRVLVEAMASGVPVVTTNSGGVAEIVRHEKDGLLVSPGDDRELASAIAKFLKNESLRKRYAQSAMKRAEYFSLDAHVDKIAQVFKDVIDAKN